MARKVVSVLSGGPAALHANEPVLEANAYAVAADVDLQVVLRADAVELAVAGAEAAPSQLAGVSLPPSASAQDLRGLVESGVAVQVAADDLAPRGLTDVDLVRGVSAVDAAELAALLRDADAVLTW